MEETKLDKFVGKIFNSVEKLSKLIFIEDETKKRKALIYIAIVQFFIGISGVILHHFWGKGFFGYISPFSSLLITLVVLHPIIKNTTDIDLKILKFSRKLYSEETTKLCFEPLIADWKTEFSLAIAQNRRQQANWVTLRYVFAFLSAMFQQSKIGRLFEFIFKR